MKNYNYSLTGGGIRPSPEFAKKGLAQTEVEELLAKTDASTGIWRR